MYWAFVFLFFYFIIVFGLMVLLMIGIVCKYVYMVLIFVLVRLVNNGIEWLRLLLLCCLFVCMAFVNSFGLYLFKLWFGCGVRLEERILVFLFFFRMGLLFLKYFVEVVGLILLILLKLLEW